MSWWIASSETDNHQYHRSSDEAQQQNFIRYKSIQFYSIWFLIKSDDTNNFGMKSNILAMRFIGLLHEDGTLRCRETSVENWDMHACMLENSQCSANFNFPSIVIAHVVDWNSSHSSHPLTVPDYSTDCICRNLRLLYLQKTANVSYRRQWRWDV